MLEAVAAQGYFLILGNAGWMSQGCENSKCLGARDGGSHISLSTESGQVLGWDEIPAGAALGEKELIQTGAGETPRHQESR